MERSEREWAEKHLLAWCETQERGDAAPALVRRICRWADAEGEWGNAMANGWPWARDRADAWHAYNRELLLRTRTGARYVAAPFERD